MKTVFSIFPKYYQHLKLAELPSLIHDVGLDTTNLVVRDGYWVTMQNLAADTRAFTATMRAAGLKVYYAITGFSPEQLAQDDRPLGILAEHGITQFRMSYFNWPSPPEWNHAISNARRQLADVVRLCEKHHIRVVYQIHHGTLISHSLAARELVRDLPPEFVGVKLDPGNQCFEGTENWRNAAATLGPYLCALGVKDTVISRDAQKATQPGKGWRRDWAPIDEGVVNWHDVMTALNGAHFDGTVVFNAFYHEQGPQVMTEKLKREVAYLRRVVADVTAKEKNNG